MGGVKVVELKADRASHSSQEKGIPSVCVLEIRARKTLYWIRVRRRSVRGEEWWKRWV